MKLHRHIIRANAMLDKVEGMINPYTVDDEATMEHIIEHIQTIRSDLRHIDRKLAAFNRIVLDVLNSE